MAKERTFYGTIQLINGVKRFAPNFPKIWQHVLNQLKEGQICVIYFKIVKRVRSLSMNNLYWLYLSIIEQETGEDEVTLTDARRLYYWDGAATLSQLAMEGVSKPQNCKFPCEVERVNLTQVIEILDVTDKARESIATVAIWKQ